MGTRLDVIKKHNEYHGNLNSRTTPSWYIDENDLLLFVDVKDRNSHKYIKNSR
jgi:hypothetical protein